jgi:hypothetical protein
MKKERAWIGSYFISCVVVVVVGGGGGGGGGELNNIMATS